MSTRFRVNLQTQYSVQILLVILASMVSLSLLSVWHFTSSARQVQEVTSAAIESHLEDQLRERADVMTEYLAQDLANSLLILDLRAMLRQLATTTAQRDVVFAYVYDATGHIVHDGGPAIPAYGQSIDDLLGWEASEQRVAQARRVGNTLQFARPVRLGGELLGGVAVGLSLDVVRAETAGLHSDLDHLAERNLRRELAYAGAFTLLFMLAGTLVALGTGRRLAKPIRVLARQALQLGRGEFTQQVEISRNDEVGDLAKAFANMQDNLESNQKEIQFLAYHDPLTRLQNRASLLNGLENLCIDCREKKSLGALLFIDLDDFKPVNDTLGHEAGDALLVTASERLLACMNTDAARAFRVNGEASHSVARLGGDEFTLMLTGLDAPEQAGDVAREVLDALSKPVTMNGRDIYIGASVGIALFPADGRDAESLLARADVAMYSAKHHGKHAFRFFEEHMLQETRDKLFMINDLRHALDGDGLTVHYQPIMAASSGRVVGAEALVRWHHPKRGFIKAAEFIEIAEKGGEIERLGRWALERVCRDLAGWREKGLDGLFVSINISSQQLLRTDLPDYVNGVLSYWGLGPRDLRIEASEDRVVSKDDGTASILRQWNQAGFEIWIDNFGSGAASLLNLHRIPARGIKLDPDFIKNVTTDDRLRIFVQAIISMARSLSLEVCAVGVTSAALSDWLKQNGCRYLQGQFLGSDLNARDFLRHLQFVPGNQDDDPLRSRKAV